ncbi:MAG: hypothetical protein EXR77_15995 [Myxococcales bacterium]|nr:hypothetical protein [Myxococcales bacterium]
MFKLGDYVVEFRYRVDPIAHPQLWPLLAIMRDYTDHLGLAAFEVWQDDEDPWTIVEWHAYDSWSHWQRVGKQPELPEMKPVYEGLDRIIEGGLRGVQSRAYTPIKLPAAVL